MILRFDITSGFGIWGRMKYGFWSLVDSILRIFVIFSRIVHAIYPWSLLYWSTINEIEQHQIRFLAYHPNLTPYPVPNRAIVQILLIARDRSSRHGKLLAHERCLCEHVYARITEYIDTNYSYGVGSWQRQWGRSNNENSKRQRAASWSQHLRFQTSSMNCFFQVHHYVGITDSGCGPHDRLGGRESNSSCWQYGVSALHGKPCRICQTCNEIRGLRRGELALT